MRYVTAKSILGNFNNVNLYRGCTHGCIYCDSRSECYQVGDFEDIAVKKDAIAIFENEMFRKRNRIMVTTGSMCDPYLPLEKELQLTRKNASNHPGPILRRQHPDQKRLGFA
ncbi:MAG TPA: hypothetical protein DD618_00240 [Acholeplasmatales bacterium]|nr:hypothetical protein [Acholeplasmatales bacterium]